MIKLLLKGCFILRQIEQPGEGVILGWVHTALTCQPPITSSSGNELTRRTEFRRTEFRRFVTLPA